MAHRLRRRQLFRMPARTAVVLTVLGLRAAPAAAQRAADSPSWFAGAGVANYALAAVHGTGWGPEAVLRRRVGARLVIQARFTAIPYSTGFYEFGGAAADLGVGVAVGSRRVDATLTAGASGLAGGDSDGSFFAAGGAHLIAQANGWLAGRVGLYGSGALRVLAGSGADYGVPGWSAGIAVRF